MMSIPFMYMSELSAILLIVIYFPACFVVLWLMNILVKRFVEIRCIRIGTLICIFLVMFSYATLDAILGKYYLDQYCEKDGGTYINNSIRIDGVYFAEKPRSEIAESFLRKGFSFIEMGKPGSYVRYSKSSNGGLIEKHVSNVMSSGIIVFESGRTRVGPKFLNISVSHQFLENIETKINYGGFRNYQVYTWLDKKTEGIGSLSSTRCTDIPRLNQQDRYKNKTQYLDVLANTKES